MKLRNYKDHTIRVVSLGVVVPPGEVVEVDDGYCLPRRAANGSRVPATIEELAPGLEPADEQVRAEWRKVPPKDQKPPAPTPTAAQLEEAGLAPGVAQIVAEKKAAQVAQTAQGGQLAQPQPTPQAVPRSVASPVSIPTPGPKRRRRVK